MKESSFIVKSIVRNTVDPNRIVYRDTQPYLDVLLDDTIRKQICWIYLNTQKKYIGLFKAKKETMFEIAYLDDICKYSDALIKTDQGYEGVSGGNYKTR